MTEFSEHEKLIVIGDRSQSTGEFLDWAEAQGWHLMTLAMSDCEECEEWGKDENCSYCEGTGKVKDTWVPAPGSTVTKLADFYDIDLDKIEQEKRQMLEELQEMQEEGTLTTGEKE